jgi:hypothetical protein
LPAYDSAGLRSCAQIARDVRDLWPKLFHTLARQTPSRACNADGCNREASAVEHGSAHTANADHDFFILDRIAALSHNAELRPQ